MEYSSKTQSRSGNQTRLTTMFKVLGIFFLQLAIVTLAQKDQTFSYDLGSSNGPASWGGMCLTGRRQSPIDIKECLIPTDITLPVPPNTTYEPANGSLYNDGYSPEVIGAFGTFQIGSTVYPFSNFHFHSPADHAIDGFRYPLEMHIVHETAAGQVAVIAVFFKIGAFSSFLNQFFHLLPLIEGPGRPTVPLKNLNLFEPTGQYVRYNGSLTTPPCNEGVSWTVMLNPMTLSAGQFNQYRQSFPDPSARAVQPLNGRIPEKSIR